MIEIKIEDGTVSIRIEREEQIEPVTEICNTEGPEYWICSLQRGHKGNHKAYRSHDRTTPLLKEWLD